MNYATLDLNPIECAISDLLDAREGRYLGHWESSEMRELKRECSKASSPAFAMELYRAMVAEKNGWTHRGGWADINTVEKFAREWESFNNQ